MQIFVLDYELYKMKEENHGDWGW